MVLGRKKCNAHTCFSILVFNMDHVLWIGISAINSLISDGLEFGKNLCRNLEEQSNYENLWYQMITGKFK